MSAPTLTPTTGDPTEDPAEDPAEDRTGDPAGGPDVMAPLGTTRPAALDLREDPWWLPVRTEAQVGGWHVRTWTEPRLPGEACLDRADISVVGRQLRLSVIDPALNGLVWDARSRAQAAAGLTAGILRDIAALDTALLIASASVNDPDLLPRHRNPLLALAVADLDPAAPRVHATRCADAEVWVLPTSSAAAPSAPGSRWRSLFPGDMLTPSARQLWRQALTDAGIDRRREGDNERAWRLQEALLDDPDRWQTTSLGLTARPRPQHAPATSVAEVIVSTDGARLTADRCADLDGWLTGDLQVAPAGHRHLSPHGDIAVIHARWTGTPT